tara:strand:- start:529 stop:1350 length:822 start_codon:yes stop_codon:yes gene_type:complete
MRLELDRIALDDAGSDPVRLAAAIHKQLPDLPAGYVPVEEIALGLDIVEIRVEDVGGFEGALITQREKSYGSILVAAKSSSKRRRFTVGHELCHFLHPRHQATNRDGFRCAKIGLAIPEEKIRHLRQEYEADLFAIELLAPRNRVRPYLEHAPDLGRVIAMSETLRISKAAAVRRYANLHSEKVAAIFSQNGVICNVVRPKLFPYLGVWNNHPLPAVSKRNGNELGDWSEGRAGDWLGFPAGKMLLMQTLHQIDGRATTLLHVVSEPSLVLAN